MAVYRWLESGFIRFISVLMTHRMIVIFSSSNYRATFVHIVPYKMQLVALLVELLQVHQQMHWYRFALRFSLGDKVFHFLTIPLCIYIGHWVCQRFRCDRRSAVYNGYTYLWHRPRPVGQFRGDSWWGHKRSHYQSSLCYICRCRRHWWDCTGHWLSTNCSNRNCMAYHQ